MSREEPIFFFRVEEEPTSPPFSIGGAKNRNCEIGSQFCRGWLVISFCRRSSAGSLDFPPKPTPWPPRSKETPEGKAVHTGKAKGRAVERGRKGGHRKGGSGKDKAARTHGTRQPTHPAGSVATFGTLLLPTALIPPPALPPRPMPLLPSYARLGVFAKGVAHGLALAG